MLTLPRFELLKRQPDPPHVAPIVVRRCIPNEHGAAIVYTVHRGRKGTEWWISASIAGMRMSNTLHTTSRPKAETWIRAVNAGEIQIEGES